MSELEDGEECCWKMGRNAVRCRYTQELTVVVVTAQDEANKISQHPTESTDWTWCITNKTGGYRGGGEIGWVVLGGNNESRGVCERDKDTLFR